jgi:hypothetical protein
LPLDLHTCNNLQQKERKYINHQNKFPHLNKEGSKLKIIIFFDVHIIIKYFVIHYILMPEENKKKFDCNCGAAFDTVEELDKHNHEAH